MEIKNRMQHNPVRTIGMDLLGLQSDRGRWARTNAPQEDLLDRVRRSAEQFIAREKKEYAMRRDPIVLRLIDEPTPGVKFYQRALAYTRHVEALYEREQAERQRLADAAYEAHHGPGTLSHGYPYPQPWERR